MSVDGFGKDSKLLAASQEELRPICDGTAGGGELPRSGRGAAPERSAASTGARPPDQEQAPASGITGASTSQGEENGGGVDYLEVRCRGAWNDEAQFDELCDILDNAKSEAQDGNIGGTIKLTDGRKLVVHPKGYRAGNTSVDWKIEFQGLSLGVSRERFADEDKPNVFITITSLILMQLGHLEAWKQALGLLAELGFQLKSATASRCDICVDMVGHCIEDYSDKYQQEAYICRARSDNPYRDNRRTTGIKFGKEPSCRIYDKVAECIDDPAKLYVTLATRWGGKIRKLQYAWSFNSDATRCVSAGL